MTKLAFVFPGQGSQLVGMGKEIAEAHPEARAVFDQADEVLGYSLSHLCFEGPEADLNDTAYTQPALYVCGIATLRALQSVAPDAKPMMMAGHGLGELTALRVSISSAFAAVSCARRVKRVPVQWRHCLAWMQPPCARFASRLHSRRAACLCSPTITALARRSFRVSRRRLKKR